MLVKMVQCQERVFLNFCWSVGRTIGVEITSEYDVCDTSRLGQVIAILEFSPEIVTIVAVLLAVAHCKEQFVLRYRQLKPQGFEIILV
jgi:hypothetical protein